MVFFFFLVNGLKCASPANGPLRCLCLDHTGVPWIYNSSDPGCASGAIVVVFFFLAARKQIAECLSKKKISTFQQCSTDSYSAMSKEQKLFFPLT